MPAGPLVVTGGAGRLARAIGAEAADALLLTRSDLDIADAPGVDETLDRLRPWAVINTAALADVDACEAHPRVADQVNNLAAGSLASACAQRGIPLVHVSTDYVFGAGAAGPHAEASPVDPVGVYGRSKAQGEARVFAAGGTACVARVAWLFGYPGDFLDQMFARFLAGEPPRVFDQRGSPTPIILAARAVVQVARRLSTGDPTPPILHLAGGPPASRADWFGAALEAFGHARGLETPPIGLVPVPAMRPRDSALDTRLAAALLGLDFGWREAAMRRGEAMLRRP